jgi:O-methyltransferase
MTAFGSAIAMCFDARMSLKGFVNSVMFRTTGYQFTRETPDQRQEAIRAASRHAAARARKRTAERHRRQAAKQEERRRAHAAKRRAERAEARRQAEAKRRAAAESARLRREERTARGGPLANYDEDLRTTVERVQPRTMTGPAKLAALVEATRHVVHRQVPGAVVECGVWRGGSMQAVALTLLALGETERELHLFDTFEGMPPPTENDSRTTQTGTVYAEELLSTSGKDSKMWAVAGLDDVQTAMAETRYPSEKVHFHRGLVEDTTPGEAPETIALLRLDTDWYASTKHELEHLYDRLSPGGVLILDDYGDWDGARKATDEWLAKTGEPLFLAPMGSGRIAIKPPAPVR